MRYKSVLLYPAGKTSSGKGDYDYKRAYVPENICAIETISVLNQQADGLDKEFGSKVLNIIVGETIYKALKIELTTAL